MNKARSCAATAGKAAKKTGKEVHYRAYPQSYGSFRSGKEPCSADRPLRSARLRTAEGRGPGPRARNQKTTGRALPVVLEVYHKVVVVSLKTALPPNNLPATIGQYMM